MILPARLASLLRRRLASGGHVAAAGTITVNIEADVSGFIAALDRARVTADRMRWRSIQARERLAARSWFDTYAEAAWARYGWARPHDRYDWPMPRRGR